MTDAGRPLLIVKTGDTLDELRSAPAGLGDFEDWVRAGLQATDDDGADAITAIDIIDARTAAPLPALQHPQWAGIVVTGSHAMVTDRAPWSESLGAWLVAAAAQGTPVLGICYGHQLLAQALGGDVAAHPEGVELGTVDVSLAPDAAHDPLFAGLPSRFAAQTVHFQSVRRLPAGAVRLAGNGYEAHHGFRWGAHLWGVQFHPEFNAAAMRGYVDHLVPTLARQGHDPRAVQALQTAVADTPVAASLLPRFARWCTQRVSATPAASAVTAA